MCNGDVQCPGMIGFYLNLNILNNSYPPGWYSHVKAHRNVPPKWVTFSPKILKHGSHFGQKNPWRRVPFYKICRKKNIKSAVFEAEKPLEMGLKF